MLRIIQAAAILCLTLVTTATSVAQPPQGVVVEGAVPPEMRARMEAARAQAEAGKQPKPGEPKPGDDKDKKKEEDGEKKDGDKSDDEGPKPVTRPDKPKDSPNPDELKVKPDDQGQLMFQFRGQPWPAVIQWYSEISKKAIDWRELPGDYLNVRTQRPYSIEETRDLLNRHLLARGYALLHDGEFLSVEKTEGINTALVPRVRSHELEDLLPHDFVKTSFKLRRLLAEDLVKELEPMKSKNGKLTALKSTNRIEAVDAAKNLQEMYDVLEEEQSGGRALDEFILKHVRAVDVREKLEELLGIEKKASSAPMTPQQMQQMQQMRQQMQQQNKGKPQPQKKEATIRFIVNERRNSVIAQAPPDKMMIISDAVQLLDVEANRGDSLDAYLARIQTYRLATLDPEEVVNILLTTGGLDPSTQLRVDNSSQAIIASAPPWDHLTIQRLVKKLDGSARQFKVVRLRNLAADQVATTIEAMMVGPQEDDSSRRRSYFYYGYGRDRDENKNKDKFRVGADVEYNRLLLWCNETELEEVMKLLEELGEIPSAGGNANRIRVLESLPASEEEELLRRLQEAFKSIAPNPVELPPAKAQNGEKKESSEIDALESDSPVKEASRPAASDEARTLLAQAPIRFAQYPQSGDRETRVVVDDRAERTQAPSSAPPIRITRGRDGRLVVTCADPRALDLFEELMERITPPKQDFEVFTLKYASSYWTALQLEDFFEDAEEKPRSRFTYYFYDYYNQGNDDKKRLGLDERPKLKFISETDTNTIIVRNATEDQLATVRQLIEIYDIPEPVNNQSARFTRVIPVQYSRSSAIATTIKDAFRDLLSGNDKAFQQQKNGEGQDRGQRSGGFGSFMRGFGDDDSGSNGPRASFKGKLSIGSDDSTNTLIITTEGEKLMEIVAQMIKELDDAAKPNDDVRVVSLPGGTSPTKVHEIFSRLFGEAVGKSPQGGPPEGQRPDRENGDRRERGRRGERDGRGDRD